MERNLIVAILCGVVTVTVAVLFFIKDSAQILPINQVPSSNPSFFVPGQWVSYTDPDLQFSLKMPSFPEMAKKTVKDPNTRENRFYEMYVSEQIGGHVFMVSKIQFIDRPKELISDQILDEIMKNMVDANPENQLISNLKRSFLGYTALDYTIVNEESIVRALSFRVGNAFFVLTIASRTGEINEEAHRFFLNSFSFTPSKNQTLH